MKLAKVFIAGFLIIGSCLFLSNTSLAADLSTSQQSKILNISIPWSENVGQLDESVKYSANTFMGTVFITDNGSITYSLKEKEKDLEKSVVIKEIPLSINAPVITGQEKTEVKTNYFIGSDKSKWQSNVSTYNIVSLGNIYPNIKLQLKAHGNNVEKLYTVSPKGNPNDIKMKVEGAKKLTITKDGQLKVDVKGAKPIYFTKPIAYQDINGTRVNISIKYKLNKNTYSFILGKYNKEHSLVIDPEFDTLLASTYVGGTGGDLFAAIVVGTSSLYVAGYTASANFPTSTSGYRNSYSASYDTIVFKMNLDINQIEASTFIGGSGNDYVGRNLILSGGYLYFSGTTNSSDFPTTTGAYGPNLKGSGDGYVVKLSNDLSSLVASTYIGGSGDEPYANITIDNDNMYVYGGTTSADFPTTTGAYQTSFRGGNRDGFILKISGDLTQVLASTYLGGSGVTGFENVAGLVINSSEEVVVVGSTDSPDFPTTTGAYQTTIGGGGYDMFLGKFDSNLTTLVSSTFFGGSAMELATSCGIVLDANENIFIIGTSYGAGTPTTPEAYQTSFGGSYDMIAAKFNTNLNQVLGATYLGGSAGDSSQKIKVDSEDNIYIGGGSGSDNYPITAGVYSTPKADQDQTISKLSNDLTSLLGSTFIGGTGYDSANSFDFDSSLNLYMVGFSLSSDFPTSTGAITKTYQAGATYGDATIIKFGNPLPTVTALSPTRYNLEVGTPFTLTVYGTGFVPSSTIKINGVSKTTTYVSATVLTAEVSIGDFGSQGTYPVTVYSPLPGGGTSASSTFTVYIQYGASPAPVVSVPSSPSSPSTPVVTQPVTPVTTTSPAISLAEATAKATSAGCPELPSGTMVKVDGKPAIYSVNNNLQALYFPSGDEFKSWNTDEVYGGYITVSQQCFDALSVPTTYPGAVNFRPGSYIIKKASFDQLYVVEPNNTLAKITDTDAKALYGTNYTVKTISEPFWPHYINRGTDITGTVHTGMLINKDNKTYYVDTTSTIREVTITGMVANRFKPSFIRTVPDSYLTNFTTGALIEAEVPGIANRVQ